MIPRFYCTDPLTPGDSVGLPETAAHHAAHVLRLKPGDACFLFNGDGAEYSAVIERIGKNETVAAVTGRQDVSRESPLAVTLAQALCAGDKMDLVVRKAVELGASRIVPVWSARSVVRLQGGRAAARVRHWQAVAIAACEQCGRNRIPEVTSLTPLDDWLEQPPPAPVRWMLSPQGGQPFSELDRPSGEVVLLVGPEAGFSEPEQQAARAAGYRAIRLGPRVLRTETAALAALAALQGRWGDF